MKKLSPWLKENGVDEVECVIPDFTGCARGKIMPAGKFIQEQGIRLPESIFMQGVTGDYVDDDVYYSLASPNDGDMILKPDENAAYPVPWALDPTVMILHDCFDKEGEPVARAPRNVLRKVLEMYSDRGLKPVVAPELEFYLTKPCANPDFPLEAPVGRSGRQEVGGRAYSIDAANEFDPMFEDVYAWSEAQGLDIDTLIHEMGTAQMEINFRHGDPLALADQVFVFKRTVREAALKHNITATFMAKPISNEPGSSMHIHQSILDANTGNNIFSDADGNETEAFYHFIGGLQKYIPELMPLFAPNVNSYRRFLPDTSAPVNLAWGVDNRTASLRIPDSSPKARRVENRLAGADANVYLALAGSLLAGLLGMERKCDPSKQTTGSAYEAQNVTELPLNLEAALDLMSESEALKETLGSVFVETYVEVKWAEYQNFKRVISSWERQHLLTTV
ncbi:glutamine synthetase family protein [Parendozoicomonas haliclonae]|uniref:Gamma-glutamylputrescine synthetase PuuA n=1 Tax=Parendozoicomonas haliclonae TaxID=1960125 RepID=A0A1X7ATQ8_9GAMM|nr:glutamine synthetase family protein [Parendozoicomonas haliclonae]SMA50797.1 Gamma-glutamylputrescine synthetase PuuA [Parendozoicomonas haliclonae]